MNASTAVAGRHYTTASVTSEDGTTIGYRRLGNGPPLVVVHGAMESAQSHTQLAEALAGTFTVCLPDRRGRGLSGPYGKDYGIHKEVEDLDALLSEVGADRVFGVSSGALICLEAARVLPTIRKAAIFEPPLMATTSVPASMLTRLDDELARGDVAAALITGIKAGQMGPPIFNVVPRWPLEQLTRLAMAGEDKKAGADFVSMRALAPTLHYDFQLVRDSAGTLETFRAIRAEVLLLGGDKSPAYLKAAVDALEKVLPDATRVEFPGVGHGATGNTDRGGKPSLVAQVLRHFFAGQALDANQSETI